MNMDDADTKTAIWLTPKQSKLLAQLMEIVVTDQLTLYYEDEDFRQEAFIALGTMPQDLIEIARLCGSEAPFPPFPLPPFPPPYTREQEAYILQLFESIRYDAVAMAVVDFFGRRDSLEEAGLIDAGASLERRFGIRSMAHCKVYKFSVIFVNKKWLQVKQPALV